MSDQQYLTEEGANDLRAELEDLLTVKRPALSAKLKEAISQGDLSENADYHDAKEQQAFLEGRILYLEGLLHSAVIVADNSGKKASVINLRTEATVQEGSEPPAIFIIVAAAQDDPRAGYI